MMTYQFSPRAGHTLDYDRAIRACGLGGAKRIRRTFPRMWETDSQMRRTRPWNGRNQPETIRFQVNSDDQAWRIAGHYGTETAFVESFAGHYV